MQIEGKVAVVTGAGSGIGRATARALARAGAVVVVADVDEAGGSETVGLVHDAGGHAGFRRTDVTEPRSLEATFAAVEADHGGLDIVHNNAGLVCGEPLWPDITPETLLRVMAVNLGGVVVGTRLAIPALRRRGGGAIVNTASMAALYPLTPDPIYSATKAGVAMFTRACAPLAEEGIRVNAVLPGLVDTPLLPKSGDADAVTSAAVRRGSRSAARMARCRKSMTRSAAEDPTAGRASNRSAIPRQSSSWQAASRWSFELK